ncbi:MAG: alkaline phosphatase [Pseudomonadota bacterium]
MHRLSTLPVLPLLGLVVMHGCGRHPSAPPRPGAAHVSPGAMMTAGATAAASAGIENACPSAAPAAVPPPPPQIRHVIIISEDGLRPDALIQANGSVHAWAMREGSFSLVAQTIRRASTLPSHAAMLSGFDEPAHKLWWNSWMPARGHIQVPTVFDAVTQSGYAAAAFVGKQKLEHIAYAGSVDVFSRPGLYCKQVVGDAARYFVEKRPRLEFIHFSDPDERGHAIGWMSEPQIEAIRHTDVCLATLIAAVRAAGLDQETLFILSADHGGHGRNHSGRIKEDRLIPWIAWGAGVRRDHRITSPINTMDTAATTLWALGYQPPPEIEGRPVLEAFFADQPVASARPSPSDSASASR